MYKEELYNLMQDFQKSASELNKTLDAIWSLCTEEECSLWEKEGCNIDLTGSVLDPEQRRLAGELAVKLVQFLY